MKPIFTCQHENFSKLTDPFFNAMERIIIAGVKLKQLSRFFLFLHQKLMLIYFFLMNPELSFINMMLFFLFPLIFLIRLKGNFLIVFNKLYSTIKDVNYCLYDSRINLTGTWMHAFRTGAVSFRAAKIFAVAQLCLTAASLILFFALVHYLPAQVSQCPASPNLIIAPLSVPFARHNLNVASCNLKLFFAVCVSFEKIIS